MSVTYKKVLTGDRSSVWVIPTVDNPCVLWTFGAGLDWLTAFPPSEFSCGIRNQPASWVRHQAQRCEKNPEVLAKVSVSQLTGNLPLVQSTPLWREACSTPLRNLSSSVLVHCPSFFYHPQGATER